MTISLSKGQRIDLTKTNPGLKKAIIGLGWDINKYNTGGDYDLDASAFLLNNEGKARGIDDFIFYNNLQTANGSVKHTGDNRTGQGEGDDEQIVIDFSLLPQEVERIGITVTIDDAVRKNQNFGHVSNAFVRVVDEATNHEILRYDLGEEFSLETAIVVCELYRNQGEWKFQAIGSGFQGGLAALCQNYGLDAK
ncbi:TerD family protein [Paenibacillus durus]|uniref:Chemical-damaging agent resistance protein C n=1 Tax=Paenibacillus durus ATCC 35681 TaxID=1333534 RepID=A0A0F7F6G7_PAEDU|nr:TerD family protein [Paenibacillus durus]AKG33353.1 chemical-damaging agent resistance protein C [Paenibacillus durus ATCC 35681]